jgi:hypothetical protein
VLISPFTPAGKKPPWWPSSGTLVRRDADVLEHVRGQQEVVFVGVRVELLTGLDQPGRGRRRREGRVDVDRRPCDGDTPMVRFAPPNRRAVD